MTVTIAVDMHGGDKAPFSVVEGIKRFLKNNKTLNIAIVGYVNDSSIVESISDSRFSFKVAKDVISADMKPSRALRFARTSTMGMAIQSVADKQANAIFSCGNTGALMVLSKILLKSLPNFDRPALASYLPSYDPDHSTFMLDLGANSECTAKQLHQFAQISTQYVRSLRNIPHPKVGLLNIGTEIGKGNQLIDEVTRLLSDDKDINFCGYVEGDGILMRGFDIIVTDGFTGNVALKSLEGTTKFISYGLRSIIKNDLLSKIAFFLSARIFRKMKELSDPRNYNGAILLGLNGICIKGHGGSDFKSVDSALGYAYEAARIDLNSGTIK